MAAIAAGTNGLAFFEPLRLLCEDFKQQTSSLLIDASLLLRSSLCMIIGWQGIGELLGLRISSVACSVVSAAWASDC